MANQGVGAVNPCVLVWCVELYWYMYWSGVLDWYGQSSTYNSAYNTPVQYIQHTSPVHTTHQSSTYNTPVQHIDGWISSKIKNGVAISPENRKDVFSLKDMWV